MPLERAALSFPLFALDTLSADARAAHALIVRLELRLSSRNDAACIADNHLETTTPWKQRTSLQLLMVDKT